MNYGPSTASGQQSHSNYAPVVQPGNVQTYGQHTTALRQASANNTVSPYLRTSPRPEVHRSPYVPPHERPHVNSGAFQPRLIDRDRISAVPSVIGSTTYQYTTPYSRYVPPPAPYGSSYVYSHERSSSYQYAPPAPQPQRGYASELLHDQAHGRNFTPPTNPPTNCALWRNQGFENEADFLRASGFKDYEPNDYVEARVILNEYRRIDEEQARHSTPSPPHDMDSDDFDYYEAQYNQGYEDEQEARSSGGRASSTSYYSSDCQHDHGQVSGSRRPGIVHAIGVLRVVEVPTARVGEMTLRSVTPQQTGGSRGNNSGYNGNSAASSPLPNSIASSPVPNSTVSTPLPNSVATSPALNSVASSPVPNSVASSPVPNSIASSPPPSPVPSSVTSSPAPNSVASSPVANSVASSPGPVDDGYFEKGDGFVEEEDVYMDEYDDDW